MARGARALTKKEKEKIQLCGLVDRLSWQLTGTLVPTPKRISQADLRARIEKAVSPYSGFFNGRHTIVINCNVWAEEILPQDGEEE